MTSSSPWSMMAVLLLLGLCCYLPVINGFLLEIPVTRSPTSTSTSTSASSSTRRALVFLLRTVSDDNNEDDNVQEQHNSKQEAATYYSPNVPLDQSRYYTDQQGSTGNEQQQEQEQSILENSSTTSTSTTTTATSSTNEYSFFDEAIINVRAGSGGQGSSTYKKGVGGQNGPPDGGNGGRGGNVILVVDDSLNTLAGLTNAWRPNSFGGSGAASNSNSNSNSNSETSSNIYNNQRKSFRAENGQDGIRQYKTGRTGKDVIIRVPPGTVVQEEIVDGEDDTITYLDMGSLTTTVVDDIDTIDNTMNTNIDSTSSSLIVAYGGEGGEGSGINGKGGRGIRRIRIPPQGGEKKIIKLTLKIVADVALVGVPNCGKSTLLAAVTRAKPKIANYPFTTVIPNLGVWIPPEAEYYNNNKNGSDGREEGTSGSNRKRTEGSGSDGLVLCDVPGLIAGAAQGIGLGHAFLRHVERCHVILHLVDATSIEPLKDFHMLNREMMNYGSGQLGKMPQVVVVNKVDALRSSSTSEEENEDDYDDDDQSENNTVSRNSNKKEGTEKEDWELGLQSKMTREELELELQQAMTHSRLLWISAKEKEGVNELMTRLAAFVKKVKETTA